ncbi:MAG: hypothetical protein QOJ41_641 [Acidobacteriaceae bacterium]|nr:hypothetical protein [Acidobacteriaceae bacterium]
MRDPGNPLSGRRGTVQDDWRARLPEEKLKVFTAYMGRLESTYCMLSVSLNEALTLRHEGRLIKCCEAVNVTPSLCRRLSVELASLIRALGEHAKHYGTVPNAAPLDPQNFQTTKGQRSARMSGLLSKVLLSHRTQFLHKLSTLLEIVENLGKEYCLSAEELGGGLSTDPALLWKTIDAAHYDLNTCLRETIVLLKSFLRAVPDDQLASFQKSVMAGWRLAKQESDTMANQDLRDGRIAHSAGQ